MNKSMGVASAMAGVADEEEVVISVFLTIWGQLFPLDFPIV